ncbi:MAG: hypothetical protein ABEL51_02585, partial [Salinibacter sp.]
TPSEDYFHGKAFDNRWQAKILEQLGDMRKARRLRDESSDIFSGHFAQAHIYLDEGLGCQRNAQHTRAIDQFASARRIWDDQNYLRGYLENTLLIAESQYVLGNKRDALDELTEFFQAGVPMGSTAFHSRAESLLKRVKPQAKRTHLEARR